MRKITGLAVALGLTGFAPAMAQQVTASPQVLRERIEGLEYLMKRQPLEDILQDRRICASGRSPAAVARSRSIGAETQPDASDLCATLLARTAREGQLLGFYRDLLIELGADGTSSSHLPAAIAATVLKGESNQVPIGTRRAALISSALALDAGFTVAYQKVQQATPAMPDLRTLKPIAERCLALSETNLGLCYSTGYVYGARAVSGRPMAEL